MSPSPLGFGLNAIGVRLAQGSRLKPGSRPERAVGERTAVRSQDGPSIVLLELVDGQPVGIDSAGLEPAANQLEVLPGEQVADPGEPRVRGLGDDQIVGSWVSEIELVAGIVDDHVDPRIIEWSVVPFIEEPAGLDDDKTPEPAAARRSYLPSSMGMSILIPK